MQKFKSNENQLKATKNYLKSFEKENSMFWEWFNLFYKHQE